jgi:hypothetical protein
MSISTKVLDEILHKKLRPWLDSNLQDVKYAPKLSEVKEVLPAYPYRFEINFLRPFDNKTKFYSRVINNAVAEDVSNIISLIKSSDHDDEILYWLNDTLDKKLKSRIQEIGDVLKEKDYSPIYLKKSFVPSQDDKPHQANTYIMQLLKLAYMQVYLEIQEEFKNFRNDILIPEDFYLQLLNEEAPDKIPISKVVVIEVEPEIKKTSQKRTVKDSIPVHSFTYKKIEDQREQLTDLWNNLKLNNFISEDTTLANFRKVFSGREISTPVRWIGNISELFYFVKLFYTVHQLVENEGQKNWEITCNCFVDESGNPFNRTQFRNLKAPKRTGSKIEKAVKLLF